MRVRFLAGVFMLIGLGTGAAACPTYSMTGASYNLTGDQLSRPQSLSVTAGGENRLSDCPVPGVGYAATAPDFTFYLSGMERYRLTLGVQSACDSTLLVNTADAQWYFDDDSGGNLMPRMELSGSTALNGRVDVWVGTYNRQLCAATLTMRTTGAGIVQPPQAPGAGSTGGTPQGPGFAPTTTLDRITVLSATYGANCGAPQGNVTGHIAGQCNGQSDCEYRVDYTVIGDPAVGCSKDYTVSYHCGDGVARTAHAGPEAGFGSIVTLQCAAAGSTPQAPGAGSTGGTPQGPGFAPTTTLDRITVLSATYGANCGAPQGNVTGHIAGQCNGQSNCDYRVDYTVIGDPAVGCSKDYTVSYHCGDGVARTAHAGPEAGFGSIVTLQCAAGGP